MHAQLRSLTILDDLIQNAGPRFQRGFADESILERLRFAATDPLSDRDVKEKCEALFRQWAISYRNTPGMERLSSLYKQLPQKKKFSTKENSRVLRETEVDEDEEEAGPSRTRSGTNPSSRKEPVNSANSVLTKPPPSTQAGSSFFSIKDRKSKKGTSSKFFDLERELPRMKAVMASAAVESTNLTNAMKRINREKERVSDNVEARTHFDTCKQLRRQTYRFCSLVEDEKYIGSLLVANDSLSDALLLYEQLDRSFDYDSDSDDYESHDGPETNTNVLPVVAARKQLAGLNLHHTGAAQVTSSPESPRMPPRPPIPGGMLPVPQSPRFGKARQPELEPQPKHEPVDIDEDDEDDPFADSNEVSETRIGKDGRTW